MDSGEPAPTSLSECDSLHAEHEDASLTAPEIGKTIGLDVEDRVARDEGSHHVANGVQLSGDVALIAETVVPSPATSRDRDVSSAAPDMMLAYVSLFMFTSFFRPVSFAGCRCPVVSSAGTGVAEVFKRCSLVAGDVPRLPSLGSVVRSGYAEVRNGGRAGMEWK